MPLIFLIVAFLNIGKFYGKNDGSAGRNEAELFTFKALLVG